jgi:menaquinone-dependent protoporphyrinogen oxidase
MAGKGSEDISKRGEGVESHMKVLVSAASKHGATAEIAQEIGQALREAVQERGVGGDEDVVVDVRPAEKVASVDDYDGVVLGSAVYGGH